MKKGRARLLDLGIARLPESGLTGLLVDYTMGRLGYLSPEQAHHPSAVSPRSDEWSLAALVYEALAGAPPHLPTEECGNEQAAEAFFTALADGRPPAAIGSRNPTVPKTLEQTLLRALDRDPSRRFASVKEFVTAVGRAGRPTVELWEARQPSKEASGQAGRRGRSPKTRVALLGAGALAALALGVALSRRSAPGSDNRATVAVPPVAAPRRAERPSSAEGSITIVAEPAGAAAVLPSGERHSLPVTLHRPIGTQLSLLLEKEGFVPIRLALTFSAEPRREDVRLEPKAAEPRQTSAQHGASRSTKVRDKAAPTNVRRKSVYFEGDESARPKSGRIKYGEDK